MQSHCVSVDSALLDATNQSDDIFPRDLPRRILPIVIFGLIAYIVLFFAADARATKQYIDAVSVSAWLTALALVIAGNSMRALRWHGYLRIIGVKIRPIDSFIVFLVGLAMSVTPGKFGEIVKSLLLKEGWQVPVARSGPIIVAERVTDLLAVLLLGGVGLLATPQAPVPALISWLGALALLVLLTNRRLGMWVIDLALRIRFVGARRDKLVTVYASFQRVVAIGPLLLALACALVAWGLMSLSLWVLANAFPDASLSVVRALLGCCGPLLVGALAFIPGGLGATEASMTGVLMSGSEGMPASLAVAVTLLFRLLSFWFTIGVGFAGLLVWRVRRKSIVPEMTDGEAQSTSVSS